jgi:hypothetical protein
MKEIYLAKHSKPVSIDDGAYERILEIVQASKVCSLCEKPYSQNNPCVVRNTCKLCLSRNYPHLDYAGTDTSGAHITYHWRDARGYIHLSDEVSDEATQDQYATALYYGFPVPNEYQGQELEKRHWYIHGNFRENQAIILRFYRPWGNHLIVTFLVYKDGTVIELNKRKKNIQKLFQAARQRAGAQDTNGYYHIKGEKVGQLLDDVLYDLISDIASEISETIKE